MIKKILVSAGLLGLSTSKLFAQGPDTIKHFSFSNLPVQSVSKLLTRETISGENGTIAYYTYQKGGTVPTHHHINEQFSLILKGRVSVIIEGKETIVKAGEGIIIPPNKPHSFKALEDNTVNIDFFTPASFDWIYGNDHKQTSPFTKTAWDGKPMHAEVFATVDQAVGNITFTPNGDLVYSHHPFFSPTDRVVRYDTATKTAAPFPNKEWNTPRNTDDHYLSEVLGIRNDANSIIWMLDMGKRNHITPKIVGWNTYKNQLERIYYLTEPAIIKTSQPNDMVVDTKHGIFIIADEGIGNGGDGSKAALIIVDMKTGITKRLLEGHRTTLPENKPTIINNTPLAINNKPLLVGADGITADKDFEWLYYGPLNGSKIYRVRIDDLLDEQITASALDEKIQTYSSKPNNGGLSIDANGNLYLTAMETNSVAVILAKDKSVQQLTSDINLKWPDGISYNAADGYMYVSAAQVHLGAVFHNGENQEAAPYYIFRFKPIAEGAPFR